MTTIFNAMLSAIEAGEPFALGIICGAKGSSPQKKGAKALFFADGRIVGTLGGGCLEAEVRERARQALRTGVAARFELVLDHDFGWDDGLICGGKVSGVILPKADRAADLWRQLSAREHVIRWGITDRVEICRADAEPAASWLYEETVAPPWQLWVAGAGHVAAAVAPVAQQLDFSVHVFDDRPALANHARFPLATRLHIRAWSQILAEPLPPQPACALIVTRGHQHDALVLREWIRRPFAFLGMIGSRRKRRVIFEEFLADGLATEEQLARVECPVGLDIGAVSVNEIAISILARLIQRRAEVQQR